MKKLFLAVFFSSNVLLAVGPTVECRFGALDESLQVRLDELIAYTLIPGSGVSGDFAPYGFEVAVHENIFSVAIYLDEKPISGVQIPVRNVINLPLGTTVFGINRVYHEPLESFVSVQYECIKTLW